MKTKKEILEHYQNGNRFFRNVDFDTGESYVESDLHEAVFENCYFGVDFSNSNFKNAKFYCYNLKSTSFIKCDLSNAEIVDSLVESLDLKGSNILNLKFTNNTSYDEEVKINKTTLQIEPLGNSLKSDNIVNTKQIIKTPFNEEFCTQLEYRICHKLEKSDNPDLKGFWCDGVSWTSNEIQLTKKHVNDNRKIETKAWFGKTGQI